MPVARQPPRLQMQRLKRFVRHLNLLLFQQSGSPNLCSQACANASGDASLTSHQSRQSSLSTDCSFQTPYVRVSLVGPKASPTKLLLTTLQSITLHPDTRSPNGKTITQRFAHKLWASPKRK